MNTSVRTRALKARDHLSKVIVWRHRLSYKMLKDGVLFFDSIRSTITPSTPSPSAEGYVKNFAHLTLDDVLTTPSYKVEGGWHGDVLCASNGEFFHFGSPEMNPFATREEAQANIKILLGFFGAKIDAPAIEFFKEISVDNCRYSLPNLPADISASVKKFIFAHWPELASLTDEALQANLAALCLNLNALIPTAKPVEEWDDRSFCVTAVHLYCAHFLAQRGWRHVCRSTVRSAFEAVGLEAEFHA